MIKNKLSNKNLRKKFYTNPHMTFFIVDNITYEGASTCNKT